VTQARELGLEIGYDRPPVPGRIDGAAAVRFERIRRFGRNATTDPRLRFVGEGTPSLKARFALGYSRVDADARFGLTTSGNDNALVGRSVTLGDVRLHLRLANAIDVRIGVENLFGTIVMDSRLAPYFVPRSYTLTFGAAADSDRR
jgi:hypothetical protein